MYSYSQSTGQLTQDGAVVGTGYSGHGDGLNNPDLQDVEGEGPIHLGPIAMPLTPDPANVMFGRSAFFMHGDNAAGDHSASDGCIIMGPTIRAAVRDSGDDQLTVTA
jgi:hypothetical protein